MARLQYEDTRRRWANVLAARIAANDGRDEDGDLVGWAHPNALGVKL